MGNCEEIQKGIKNFKKYKQHIPWRNREERQILILLKLLSSKTGYSKLSVLGSTVNVATATVLKDIRRLNLLFSPLSIYSRQGAGTKFSGKAGLIQNKILEYCYGVLSPMNLTAIAYDEGVFAQDKIYPCASEVFLNFVRQKVDTHKIITSINTWEKQMKDFSQNNFQISLSDITFGNLFIYLVILHIRLISGIHIEEVNKDIHIPSNLRINTLLPRTVGGGEKQLLAQFLLGLDATILFENHQNSDEEMLVLQALQKELFTALSPYTNRLQKEIVLPLTKTLLLLKYRKATLFSYWDEKIQALYRSRLKNKTELMAKLQIICNKPQYSSWLELDGLLLALDLFVEEKQQPAIEVTLFCVAGISTAIVVKKLIEKYCPKLKVAKMCSLRNCSSEDVNADVILSTVTSDVLPSHTILVDSFFNEQQWYNIQLKIFKRMEV